MVSALDEFAEGIARVRELIADIHHDLDIGDAEIRDGMRAAERRVELYRARASVLSRWTGQQTTVRSLLSGGRR
jgi:hypothetical protein